MRRISGGRYGVFLVLALMLLAPGRASAAGSAPTAEYALEFKPTQAPIDYDTPGEGEVAQCTIKVETLDGATAWVVRDPSGLTLREFADSNGDKTVDRWSYFKNGIEIYRDVDSDFDGKADRFRWLQTAGSRVGIDTRKDGKLDAWERLSPEEAAEEAVLALRTGDAERFARVALTAEDVERLQVAPAVAERLAPRVKKSATDFAAVAKSGKIAADAEFADFGGLRPGAVPAGSKGAASDLIVYENAWAMIRNGDDHQQLQLGTMVDVGGVWKLVDAPSLAAPGQIAAGIFFDNAAGMPDPHLAGQNFDPPSEALQEALEQLEQLDTQIVGAAPAARVKLNAQRVKVLQKVAAASGSQDERELWLKQIVDTIHFAMQGEAYEGGLEELAELEKQFVKDGASNDLMTHVHFRKLQSEYGSDLSTPKAQAAWFEQLEKFTAEHKDSEHVSEALLQLAMNSEFTGEPEAAEKFYRRIVTEYPKSVDAVDAKGAIVRLTCVGKPLAISGPAVGGGSVDLKQYRGKITLVHFWSSDAPTCKSDHDMLKDVIAKYGGKTFDVLGISLDTDSAALTAYLKEHRLPWKQIFEPGGFESRLANDLGIITLPLMILVDDKGAVVNNNVQVMDLDEELKKLLAPPKTAKK